MPLAKALCTKPITRIDGPARREVRDDVLAVEEPLEIRVAGRSVAVVMRTPGHDRELAAGFLVTEGLVRERDDVLDMIYCGRGDATLSSHSEHGAGAASPNLPRENVLDVVLAPGVDVDFARLSRNVFTSSSCGICSKATIEAVRREFAPLAAPVAPSRAVIAALPEKLRAAQAVFAATGGLHASALFTTGGELVVARETRRCLAARNLLLFATSQPKKLCPPNPSVSFKPCFSPPSSPASTPCSSPPTSASPAP